MKKIIAILVLCGSLFGITHAADESDALQKCLDAGKDATPIPNGCHGLLVKELLARDPSLRASAKPENAPPKTAVPPEGTDAPTTVTEEELEHRKDDHPYLESRLPNFVGYAWERGDRSFLDANLSFQYPLFYGFFKGGCGEFKGLHGLPYFSYTGRFGQYIGNTYSSPVITKTFNPEIFFRLYSPFKANPDQQEVIDKNCAEKNGSPDYADATVTGNLAYHNQMGYRDKKDKEKFVPLSYLDLQYGHLSNGQGISDLASLTAISNTRSVAGDTEFAKKYVSRGWDYLGLEGNVSNVLAKTDKGYSDTLDVQWRHYIGGLLQGSVEEYPWETPGGNIRRLNLVSGLRATYRLQTGGDEFNSAALSLETGIDSPFRYTSYRLELGVLKKLLCVPFVIWYQNGYNNDLAQYYKPVKALGVAFQFTTFGDNNCPREEEQKTRNK